MLLIDVAALLASAWGSGYLLRYRDHGKMVTLPGLLASAMAVAGSSVGDEHRSRYRLVGLDGQPHPVLDAPYDTLELALADASDWCTGLDCDGQASLPLPVGWPRRSLPHPVLEPTATRWRTIADASELLEPIQFDGCSMGQR